MRATVEAGLNWLEERLRPEPEDDWLLMPADHPTLNQLIGSMQNVQADQGLLVSWSGFKTSVYRELPAQFFRVRLWDQKAFLDELLGQYDRLDEDLKAELPLKRIWTVAAQEEGE